MSNVERKMVSIKNLLFSVVCLFGCKALVAAIDLCAASPYADICVKLGQKYYLIDGNAMLNFFEAERLCRRQNGYLVTPQNVNDLNIISEYLVSKDYLSGDQLFWIGASDLGDKGKFYSVETGNLLPYTKWIAGQPDIAGDENCVALAKQSNAFLMTTSNCDNKVRYVCELQEAPSVPKKLIITYKYV